MKYSARFEVSVINLRFLSLDFLATFEIFNELLTLPSVFLAVNFALPITQSQRIIHLFFAKNKTLFHRATNMEWLPATRYITFNALPFVFVANLALNIELVEVELAAEHCEFCVVCFEPNVSDPVDARNVYPLFCF